MAKAGLGIVATAFVVLIMVTASIPVLDKENSEPTCVFVIEGLDSYGNYVSSFAIEDFLERGFEIWDTVKIEVSDGHNFEAMLFDTYDGVLPMQIFVYSDEGGTAIGVFGLNAVQSLKLTIGSSVRITHTGYVDLDAVLPHYTNNSTYRRFGQTEEDFANFSPINLGDMLPDRYYRSSGYMTKVVKDRAVYLNTLYEDYGIQTEIFLTDDLKTADKYFSEPCPYDYLKNLYDTGRLISIYMGVNFYLQFDQYRDALLTIDKYDDAPIVFHCMMGKDRTGFVSMMMGAIAGASNEELEWCIMDSYVNLYGVQEDSVEYKLLRDRYYTNALFIMKDPSVLDHFLEVNWDNIVLEGDEGEIIREYIKKYVLSESEYAQIYETLTGLPYTG